MQNLFINIEQSVSIVLFAIGFTLLMLNRNLIKKIIGLNIMGTATYLFLVAIGYIKGKNPPILIDGIRGAENYMNPIPSGLVLTGIVVSVSFTAILLALTIRLYRCYGTLDMDKIALMAKKEEK